MAEYTENLKLFKYDPIMDAKQVFSITDALNYNWDILDKNGAGGWNLFDTKITDHVLTGDEAVGWALQGSLITNTYSDAVSKIKELYSTGTETTYREITCKKSTDGRYIADITQNGELVAYNNPANSLRIIYCTNNPCFCFSGISSGFSKYR